MEKIKAITTTPISTPDGIYIRKNKLLPERDEICVYKDNVLIVYNLARKNQTGENLLLELALIQNEFNSLPIFDLR